MPRDDFALRTNSHEEVDRTFRESMSWLLLLGLPIFSDTTMKMPLCIDDGRKERAVPSFIRIIIIIGEGRTSVRQHPLNCHQVDPRQTWFTHHHQHRWNKNERRRRRDPICCFQ